MLLNKHSFDIPARFASTKDARYILTGVQVTPDHTVGTNGHMLCMLAHQSEHKAADFPACGQSQELEPIKPFVVDAEAWSKVAKQIPKPHRPYRSMPVLLHALLDTTKANQNGSVPLHVTDLENPQTISLKKMEGNYPPYEQVFPKEDPEYTICVDPAYLEKIGKAYKDLGARTVDIALHGRLRPVVFKRSDKLNTDEQDMTVVLMPVSSPGATGQNTQAVLRQYAESVEREHEGFWEQF